MEALPKLTHHTDWLLIVLVAIFLLLTMLRRNNAQRFRDLVQLPFNIRRKEVEDDFTPNWRSGSFEIGFSLFSYLVLGLALFVTVRHHEGNLAFRDWQMFLRICFVVVMFFLLKNFIGLIVGWIFSCSEQVAKSQNTNLAYRCWMSVYLFPLSAAAIYLPVNAQVTYLLLLVFLVLGYLVGLQFTAVKLWHIPAQPYYKIFYLCALEITPLLFLLGWLKSLY